MKILVIAPQPFFSPRGTPFSVYYRTLVTSEQGNEIDFLTYGQGQDINIPNVNIIRVPKFAFLGDVKIGPSFLKLFLDVFILFKMVKLLLQNRYEVVHAHEEAVFFAYFLKPIFKFKLVYDMHSSLVQQLTNFNFTTSKIIIGIFKKLEDSCLKSAEAIITICPDLSDYVSSIITDKSKHFLIENSIFDDVCLKDGKTSSLDSLDYIDRILIQEPNKKLIVYAGTLEKYQGIDILINSFPFVVEKEPDSLLLIMGGNEKQIDLYKNLAESVGLKGKIIFTGRIPQQLVKKYNKIAKVLVSPRNEGTNTPLKIYEQIASGIPLVATNIYSHTQVLNNDISFLVEPEPKAFAGGILQALEDEELRGQKVANAKKIYKIKYSREVYSQKLKQVFEYIK
jgi:glycosyltransferase involved in cell wall biosynthesis